MKTIDKIASLHCPACHDGHLEPAVRTRVFKPHGKSLEVALQTMRCDVCGVEVTRAAQHRANLDVLAARKSHYGKLLMGEEILAMRKRYGLTQQQASRIFGKGKIAFSRYESETTYPDDSTTSLIALAIEKPEALKWLADRAGVEIPLWAERCEDERRDRVHYFNRYCRVATSRSHHASIVSKIGHPHWNARDWARSASETTYHTELTLDASNDADVLMSEQA